MLNYNPINVVCAADDSYSMPLAVTLRSLLENIDDEREINFYVIDGGISKKHKKKILNSLGYKAFRIMWLQPDIQLLKKMKISGHISISSYFRLLIPQLLPPTIKKAIYLDSDILVLKDLGKLWDIEMDDAYLLACQEKGIPYVSSTHGLANYKELGIPPDYKYFNAGVMVINLEKWSAEGISMKVIQYLEQNQDSIRWWDQDGLNAILAGKWKEIDTRWNLTPFLSIPSPNLRTGGASTSWVYAP